MPGAPKKGRTATNTLALLKNPRFRKQTLRIFSEMTKLKAMDPAPGEWEGRAQQLLMPFVAEWGVPPPHAAVVLDQDPRRHTVEAIASGRWGLVAIFSWTTDSDVRRGAKRIRQAIGKQHQDATNERRAQLARWLEDCGLPPADIAHTVWQRHAGLRRPSVERAIQKISEGRERELLAQYKRRGLSHEEAERELYRRLRGSEPAALAAVRVAKSRYVRATEALNRDLASPRHADARSYALTMLIRAVSDENEVEMLRCAKAVKKAFMSLGTP
jgi:hypothetical protein